MSENNTVYLKDYQKPAFSVDKVFLTFDLVDNLTTVTSRLLMRRQGGETALRLDGIDMTLISISIDGVALSENEYQLDDESLTIHSTPQVFELSCVTEIIPEKNTSLDGLYRSQGMYCTQCEAEGFRKITYYLDRPDVMSEFETTIIADSASFKTMLSNGNCISDKIENNKRIVTWHDPFKKPCYLFALVAGNLSVLEDTFTTFSGREVALQIFVEAKDLDKCDHAMASLKNAMKWDEQVYGREYDLDIFMIVAVDDFNMGAMENKGLNIFNTSCVLAHPSTTTDLGFQRVEAVVAHEYFHNWSGNRVTCRDWFQLSLKEGFTVYRDAEFSADMNSRAVKRIEDVSVLRSVQFPEDAGPMAHPIRPDSFIEISNFYTVTIYEKGAEIVRMLANILGKDLFRQATDLYFDTFDGQAVTCEDFVVCMEQVSGIDLKQFRHWYSQAGTPQLTISDDYDDDANTYSLTVSQATLATPGQAEKQPFHIPLKLSLYGDAGAFALKIQSQALDAEQADNTETVLHITQSKQTFVFENICEKPVPSLLRGFSAPVKLQYAYQNAQLARLMQIDSDGFSRWDAGQNLAVNILQSLIAGSESEQDIALLVGAYKTLMADSDLDAAMLALMLSLPSETYLAELMDVVDPVVIHQQRKRLQCILAQHLELDLLSVYQRLQTQVQGMQAEAIAARSLSHTALMYLMLLDNVDYHRLAMQLFSGAENMTEQSAALKVLVNSRFTLPEAEQALTDFYVKWKEESLVVNMWLQIQAASEQDGALVRVKNLMQHESFDIKNPNKARALIAGFCQQNLAQFHCGSGDGYQFLADQVIILDALNPQIAARLLTPLTRWRKLSADRAQLMRQQLRRILQQDCSKDVYEVVSKSLVDKD
ncbi:MAG: aminopeptidase N [Pseudomonadales bacterium]|nr:aminopeptidase N [Pseudomonadales bacterium]